MKAFILIIVSQLTFISFAWADIRHDEKVANDFDVLNAKLGGYQANEGVTKDEVKAALRTLKNDGIDYKISDSELKFAQAGCSNGFRVIFIVVPGQSVKTIRNPTAQDIADAKLHCSLDPAVKVLTIGGTSQ